MERADPLVHLVVEMPFGQGDYLYELRREHGRVEIVARVAKVGRTSVTVSHEVCLPDGAVAAGGSSVLVAWDPEQRGSRPLSAAERGALRG